MVLDICESCIRLENRLTVFWGLGARSGQAQEYSLTAVTGNQKFTPIIHYLHFHFSKAEINQLQISVKTCRPHSGKKTSSFFHWSASFRNRLYQIKSHNELLSSGIRRERRRYYLSHPHSSTWHTTSPSFKIRILISGRKKLKSNFSLVMMWRVFFYGEVQATFYILVSSNGNLQWNTVNSFRPVMTLRCYFTHWTPRSSEPESICS